MHDFIDGDGPCSVCGQNPAQESPCPKSPDHTHSNDWYDGGECWYCGNGGCEGVQMTTQN